jgi:glycosyltransferase involved in cell wall biosynthesis
MTLLSIVQYYNEQDNIFLTTKSLIGQTVRPDHFLLLDDGSMDNSTDIITEVLDRYRIPYTLYSMPPKHKATPNLKGKIHSIVDWSLINHFDHIMLVGADTVFPRDYIETCLRHMKGQYHVVVGRIRGELGSNTPQGTGKIFTSEIMKLVVCHLWSLCLDSLINIMAIESGKKMLIIKDLLVETLRPTHMYSPEGYYNYGHRMYYLGWNLLAATFYSIILFLRHSPFKDFIKGYIHAWTKSIERSNDQNIKNFYSFSRMIRRISGAHKSDIADIIKLEREKA